MSTATSIPMTPLKPSVLTLTNEEIEDIQSMIRDGHLPADWLDRCDEARAQFVFGVDFKRDRHGKPIEQGIGSASQITANHISAYEKWCKDEPDFERHLARMRKLYEEQQEQRNEKPKAGRR